MKIKPYNKHTNYIGATEKQMRWTAHIYRTMSGINYSAYIHDNLYEWILHNERGLIAKILLKILLDLIFLVQGFWRSFRNFQLQGMIFIFIFYILLVISSPVIIYNIYKKNGQKEK